METKYPCRYFSASKGADLDLESMHSMHLIAARNLLVAREDKSPEQAELLGYMNQELASRVNLPNPGTRYTIGIDPAAPDQQGGPQC